MSDRPHWQLGLRLWKPDAVERERSPWRRLSPLPLPLPFTEITPGKLDGELQRLLELLPQPARPAAPEPVPQAMAETLPIGLFLRGIAFSGRPLVKAEELPVLDLSCRNFFRYQVNWHGSGSDRAVDLVQLSAWATAEAIERSRKAAPPVAHTVRQFFRQIAWSGA